MLKFLARRFVNYLVLILLATCLGYLLAATSLNPRVNFEGRNPPPPERVVDQSLDELNLNNKTPVTERFVTWAGDLLHGDLGQTVFNHPVSDEMGRRIGVTVRLVVIGAILGLLLGVLAGVVSAVRHYKLTDYTLTFGSFVLLSTPVFLVGVLLKYAGIKLNQSIGSTIVYNTGETTPGLSGGLLHSLLDRGQHLVLPTLTLVLGQAAFYSRYQRNTMLDVMGSDFLRTAQAKGLRRRKALVKHGLRTALIPLATFFVFNFGLLLTGAIFTERLFSWHGLGEWFIDSINNNDTNAVAAVVLFTAFLVLLAGLISDIAYAALDPRVRIR